jgi:NAD(P)-dependent dehydrogenase (short-subunit alcohol dehydrogenase family)
MKNPMTLADYNIIVTGAAQGIGEAIARQSVDLGAHVTLVDLKEDKLKTLVAELGLLRRRGNGDDRKGSVGKVPGNLYVTDTDATFFHSR